jgi:hypothetical protein
MPDDIGPNDQLLELGRTLYFFQSIEARLKLLLPYLVPRGTKAPAPEEVWRDRRKYLDSKEMLGNLVRLFAERVSGDDLDWFEAELQQVVQCRNDVVHNFVLQSFASCRTPEDRRRAFDYLRSRRFRAQPLFELLDSLLQGFLVSFRLPRDFEGEISPELIKEILSQIEAGLPAGEEVQKVQ